jgi:hypothetical protein
MPSRKKQFVFPGAVRWPPIGVVSSGSGSPNGPANAVVFNGYPILSQTYYIIKGA